MDSYVEFIETDDMEEIDEGELITVIVTAASYPERPVAIEEENQSTSTLSTNVTVILLTFSLLLCCRYVFYHMKTRENK